LLERTGRHGRIAVRGFVSRHVGLTHNEAPPDPDGVDAVTDRSGGPVVTQSLARHHIIDRKKSVERGGASPDQHDRTSRLPEGSSTGWTFPWRVSPEEA
jgi:hypothetical protein